MRISGTHIAPVKQEFRRQRLTCAEVDLRNTSTNCVNGMIGNAFSRDGPHYIDCEDFFHRIERFGRDV